MKGQAGVVQLGHNWPTFTPNRYKGHTIYLFSKFQGYSFSNFQFSIRKGKGKMDFSDLPSCAYGDIPAALINQHYRQIYQENYVFARSHLYHYHQYASGFQRGPVLNHWNWTPPMYNHNYHNFGENNGHHLALEQASSETNSTDHPETNGSDLSAISPFESPQNSASSDPQNLDDHVDSPFYKLEIDLEKSQEKQDSSQGPQTKEPFSVQQDLKPIVHKFDGRRKRAHFTRQQVSILESYFAISHYVDDERKYTISDSTGLTVTQVRNWFQNRRMKERKRQSRSQNHEQPDKDDILPPNLQTSREHLLPAYPTLRCLLSATPQAFQQPPENLGT